MIVNVKHLKKKFKSNIVFDNLNFSVKKGSFTCIYGESGSGKTTLLNSIGLIEEIDKGELFLFEKEAPSINSKEALLLRRNRISYLFQNFGLIDNETIDYNLNVSLLYNSMYNSLSKKDKELYKKDVLKQVKLDVDLRTKIFQLSGGEKQRVAFSKILLKSSELILADEPTGSLDEKNKNDILDLLKNEQKKGKTIIIVTHDNDIINMSDNKLYLSK